jgi:raffinose/stachyose/melibiose transport system permease protein
MKKSKLSLVSILIWILAILYIYPIILVLISSLKSKAELYTNIIGLPKILYLDNFIIAFNKMNYFRSLSNNILILVIALVALTFITTMTGYAISRNMKKKLYVFLYSFFLSGIIIPFQMIMIPLYKFMSVLDLINTYHGVIMVYMATLTPISVFIYTGFIKTVPYELEEAAYIDGCGLFKRYYFIVLPLLKPAIATVVILNSFAIWNDFLMPTLFLNRTNMKTLIVSLYSFIGQYYNDWSLIFSSIFIIIYPILILYIFAQKYIIDGITAGAVKG